MSQKYKLVHENRFSLVPNSNVNFIDSFRLKLHCPRRESSLAAELELACSGYFRPCFGNEILEFATILDPRSAFLSKIFSEDKWKSITESIVDNAGSNVLQIDA